MAELNQMSSKLKSLHDIYPSIGTMKTSQSSISQSLDTVSKQVETSIDGITAASSDAQVTEAKACLVLSNDAIKRVKSHVEGDLTPLFGNCDEVESYCTRIEELRAQGASWNPGWWERVWNDIKGFFCDEWRSGDSKKIYEANKEIDRLNKKGEAQLNAMSSAINSVAFGVAGNMHSGGALGNNVTYGDNYSFSPDTWEKENPEYTSNILTKTGSLVVGAVEGVFKVGENILDAGATLVGGVVSWFSPDAGKAIADFVATDYVGNAADAVCNTLGLHDEAYRNAGNFVGSTVAHGALWLTGAGAVVSAVAVAGSSMESSLQQSNGENIWGAIGKGTIYGLSSYALGHFGKALGTKFANWANGSGSTTVIGKAYSALTKAVGTKFGSGWSTAIKGKTGLGTFANGVINIAASPLRGMTNMMIGGAKLIGGSKLASTGLWKGMGKLDAKADALSTKVVDGAVNILAKPGQALGRARNSIANRLGRGNNASNGGGGNPSNGAQNGGQNNGAQNGGQNNGAQNGGQNNGAQNGGQNNGAQNGGQNNGAQNGGQNNGAQNSGRNNGAQNGGQNNGAQNSGQNNGAQNSGRNNGAQNGGQNNGAQNSGRNNGAQNGGQNNGTNGAPTNGTNGAPTNGTNGAPTNGTNGAPTNGTNGAPTNGTNGAPTNGTNGAPTNGTNGAPINGTNGAPTNGTNGVSERGMYGVTDANRMSYNEAQRNLKNMEQYGLLDAFDSPDDIARAQELWMDSTANVADRLYGGNGVPLKQNGNWYQNAENGAKYFGQQGLGNTPDGWKNFTEDVYKIGRLDINSFGPPVVPTPVVPTPVVPTPVVPTPVGPTPVVPTPTLQRKSSIIGALIDEYMKSKNDKKNS